MTSERRTVDPDLPTQPRMAHYVLRVSDLQQSIDWYSLVLGMQTVHRNPMICFMSYDDEHHRMALVQSGVSETAPQGAPGLDHVAFTLTSLEELLATFKRLKAAGVVPVWPINHGLTTSLYYADPDGHRVEFQVENLATAEALQVYMHSDAFAENPIGVEFDPDKLLARYEQGDPLEELLKQGSA
ncbi:MAG: VOC family protein [Pseudomonadota bacterium]